MILLEYTCESCANEFDSFLPICSRCGAKARRAYRTAPQVNTKRVAPKTDKILSQEFKRRGITNFTNSGGVSRPTFTQIDPTATSVHGVPQAPIQATFNTADLSRFGVNPSSMTRNGSPYQLPDPSQIATGPLPYGLKVGEMSPEMKARTAIWAKTDGHGNTTEIDGSNGR